MNLETISDLHQRCIAELNQVHVSHNRHMTSASGGLQGRKSITVGDASFTMAPSSVIKNRTISWLPNQAALYIQGRISITVCLVDDCTSRGQ
jgi:hypothetical protein